MIAEELRRYLQDSRDSVLSSLDGLGEYDVRRPLVPSGTNLLGLVKHLAGIELGYLGESSGRPSPVALPWLDDGAVWENGDMWAKPTESREYVVDLYRRAWQHSDESIAQLPLDAPASVSWWPEERRVTTFGHLLVRVVAETAQHAGHCDIVRELIDGRSGADNPDGYYDLVLSMASAPATGPGTSSRNA
ncbi:DinB family protein [Lentzea sp. NPDC059081]|uniref:DinB family protein n=1 Tax=Lentzea sp. NPDC059081 TaxID=3346719 RepID=UPI0036BC13FE